MPADALRTQIEAGALDDQLERLYETTSIADQRTRYAVLIGNFVERFGSEPVQLFTAAGRTELAGNHTDHQDGRVLAASIHLDIVAAVRPRADRIVDLHSDQFEDTIVVDLNDLQPKANERHTSEALVRGIAAGLVGWGGRCGGFDALVGSTVAIGSGLSSSASFEMLTATILNRLYNDGQCPPLALATIARDAENDYFGKPCGLMDQVACGYGGALSIDFGREPAIEIERLPLRFPDWGLTLLVVDTGGSHEGLIPDYAAVRAEMEAVARHLGHTTLHGVEPSALLSALPEIRAREGDRAPLRALHFVAETRRVSTMAHALQHNDAASYLRLMNASGISSWTLLQNCRSSGNEREQPIPIALGATGEFLRQYSPNDISGACRIHGGGFAGAIQALIPTEAIPGYRRIMEGLFGTGCVTPLRLRRTGAAYITELSHY